MKNLLVFSFFPAFVPARSGGEVRLFRFYFELSKYFNITLLSSGHLNGEIEEIWHTNNFVEKRIPKDNHFAEQWQRLMPHSGAGDLSGPCVAASGRFLTELHKVYLTQYPKADVVVHESPFTVDYDLFRELDSKPRVYNSYNCEYELYKKLHAASPSTFIPELVRDVEERLLRNAELVTYCGDHDFQSFQHMCGGQLHRTLYIPNGMTEAPPPKLKSPKKIERALFLGSGHFPNMEAASFVANVIAPACPAITFDVIGECLPLGDYPPNVVRHGHVDATKKSHLLLSADIAINPMLSGGGSSLKILDFVAHGIPILSTSVGMRGFQFRDGIDCLVAEAEDFPALLNEYSKEAPSLAKFVKSAFDFASARYTWSTIANKFYDVVNDLACNPAAGNPTQTYVLALNDYDPFEAVGGGATRIQGIYAAVADWSRVIVICFSRGASLEVSDIASGITCVRVPKTREHIEEENYFNSRFHISAIDIVALRHADRNPILNEIYAILRKSARIVVCDHPYMSSLVLAWNDRFVYSSQNFEYGLKRGALEHHPDKFLLLESVRVAEQHCVASAAAVIAVSDEDAQNFTRGVSAAAQIRIVPNGAAIPSWPTPEDVTVATQFVRSSSAVFVGSAHMPNISAATFIVSTLAQECVEVDFHIVGAVCEALPGNLPRNVKLWGVISDSMKSAVLQQCRVAINPMFSGGGSNVKLADYLANGLHTVSTKIGIRGYADCVLPHVTIAENDSFAVTLREVLADTRLSNDENRSVRRSVFGASLSMYALGNHFTQVLQELETPKKRMLFVTYRYTHPCQGGAEFYLSRLIASAGNSGRFDVDVIAPEVSVVKDEFRFSGHYDFDADTAAPIGIRGVRFARFPLDPPQVEETHERLVRAWRAQSEFEKRLYYSMCTVIARPGLAWGWGYPERTEAGIRRWGFLECGVHLTEKSTVRIEGSLSQAAVFLVRDSAGIELLNRKLDGDFEIDFESEHGPAEFYFSKISDFATSDPRPLAMYVKRIFFNGDEVSLEAPPVFKECNGSAVKTYLRMERAAYVSRGRQGVSLTDMRGPHSSDLEAFVENYIGDYDIVVTHNNIFRPATMAIAAAKAAGIPSVLIPHPHLDDDFYHFPDVHLSAVQANLVLACPKAACEFYKSIGVGNVQYHTPGIDIDENFSEEDDNVFSAVFQQKIPFFLVLGRKAGAKGYQMVIEEIERLAIEKEVHLVLIGPDDDGLPIASKYATYLGQQPRNVVRGALRSCVALINMSNSESFGIVLLEAWLAGRPVIANAECSAFLDLAIHGENALLVTPAELGEAMRRLLSNDALADRLGTQGKATVGKYDWEAICADFVEKCTVLCAN